MSAIEWQDWQQYLAFAPLGERRADIRAAQICQTIVNMWRDTKEHPKPIPLQEFLLQFDEDVTSPKKDEKPQTVEEMQRHITDWIAGTNQAIREEQARGQYR